MAGRNLHPSILREYDIRGIVGKTLDETVAEHLGRAFGTEALKAGQKAGPLQGEINRLGNAIQELGAINMAALEELASSRERKGFLDAQSLDLNEAIQTIVVTKRHLKFTFRFLSWELDFDG